VLDVRDIVEMRSSFGNVDWCVVVVVDMEVVCFGWFGS
jgi:hypothetical protein